MRAIVVVPTYNEAENVGKLAERLLALDTLIDVLCVDDGSPDGTGRIADDIADREPRFRVLHRTGKRGYSVASKEGLAWCIERGYELVATMDADLSHDPAVLPQLLAVVEDGADVAIGSRYITGGDMVVDWGPFRRAVSRMGSTYARFMIGTPTRDCTSGFRCYRASVLASIPFAGIASEGYSFLIELLAAMRDAGARVAEVPITYVDREAGESKISNKLVLEALWRVTIVGLQRVSGTRRRAAARAMSADSR